MFPALLDRATHTLLTFPSSALDTSTALSQPQEEGFSACEVQVRGSALLWSRIQQAYREWRLLGKPTPDAYRLEITSTEHGYQKRLLVSPMPPSEEGHHAPSASERGNGSLAFALL